MNMDRIADYLNVFDEDSYLNENPDVARAVLQKEIETGYEHYKNFGRNENRKAPKKKIEANEIEQRILKLELKILENEIVKNISMVSQLIRKERSLIFYTPRSFSGNLKYCFLEFAKFNNERTLGFEFWFLTTRRETYEQLKREGLPVLLWDESQRMVKKLLRAAVLVDDGFYVDHPPLSRILHACLLGAKRMQVWHGTPIRHICLEELTREDPVNLHLSTIIKMAVDIEVFFGATPAHYQLFSQSFQFKKYEVTGYARNDIFWRSEDNYDLINVDDTALAKILQIKENKRIVCYAPTWRQGNHHWMKQLELKKFAYILDKMGYHLLLNPHPFEMSFLDPELFDDDNITTVQPETDFYPLLKQADMLITDYSSIAFDFLHLERPIIFFRPDHLAYTADRELIIAEHYSINAPVVNSIENLLACISKINIYDFTALHKSAKEHNLYLDGNSARRFVHYVAQYMENLVSEANE